MAHLHNTRRNTQLHVHGRFATSERCIPATLLGYMSIASANPTSPLTKKAMSNDNRIEKKGRRDGERDMIAKLAVHWEEYLARWAADTNRGRTRRMREVDRNMPGTLISLLTL